MQWLKCIRSNSYSSLPAHFRCGMERILSHNVFLDLYDRVQSVIIACDCQIAFSQYMYTIVTTKTIYFGCWWSVLVQSLYKRKWKRLLNVPVGGCKRMEDWKLSRFCIEIQWHTAITKCHVPEKNVRYSGVFVIAKTSVITNYLVNSNTIYSL